jgi:hypothetical protein
MGATLPRRSLTLLSYFFIDQTPVIIFSKNAQNASLPLALRRGECEGAHSYVKATRTFHVQRSARASSDDTGPQRSLPQDQSGQRNLESRLQAPTRQVEGRGERTEP